MPQRTPTPKAAPGSTLGALDIPAAQKRTAKEEERERNAVLRAALDATARPETEEERYEREECVRRLAEGGEARERSAAIKRWARDRMPRKGDE